MWQRFSERARKVVFYAQEESQRFGEGYVSTEHLLLGLVREPDNTACRILENLGVSLARVKNEVEKQLPRGKAIPSQDMTLTPRAKRIIDLAYDEARNLNDDFIGTEHLLLGLVREGDGLAARVLARLGVKLVAARSEIAGVRKAVGREGPQFSELLTQNPISQLVTQFADRGMARMLLLRQGVCRAEMLALALMPEPSCEDLLRCLKVNSNGLRTALERRITTAIIESNEATESNVTEIFRFAAEEAVLSQRELSPAHFLVALFRDENNELWQFFNDRGLTIEMLRDALTNS